MVRRHPQVAFHISPFLELLGIRDRSLTKALIRIFFMSAIERGRSAVTPSPLKRHIPNTNCPSAFPWSAESLTLAATRDQPDADPCERKLPIMPGPNAFPLSADR
jgi:hypothetical protein